MPQLQEQYQKLQPELKKELGLKSVMQTPAVKKWF